MSSRRSVERKALPPRLAEFQAFYEGVTAAGAGCLRAVMDARLRRAFLKAAVILAVISLVLMAVIHLLLLPVEWLAWLVFSPQSIQAAVRDVRYALSACIPFALVACCRYVAVGMFEKAFFSGLRDRDAQLAQRIRQYQPVYWDWEYVRHMLRQICQQGLFGLLVLLLSPLAGALLPLAKFAFRIRHMDAVYYVPVLLAFCFPSTQPMAVQVVRAWMSGRELTREIFDPVIARLKQHRHANNPEYAWRRGTSDAARIGFALVLGSLVQLPVIGALAWFPAFVAAGLNAPDLLNLKAFT